MHNCKENLAAYNAESIRETQPECSKIRIIRTIKKVDTRKFLGDARVEKSY